MSTLTGKQKAVLILKHFGISAGIGLVISIVLVCGMYTFVPGILARNQEQPTAEARAAQIEKTWGADIAGLKRGDLIHIRVVTWDDKPEFVSIVYTVTSDTIYSRRNDSNSVETWTARDIEILGTATRGDANYPLLAARMIEDDVIDKKEDRLYDK